MFFTKRVVLLLSWFNLVLDVVSGVEMDRGDRSVSISELSELEEHSVLSSTSPSIKSRKETTTSPLPTWDGCLYQVNGIGGFAHRLNISNFNAASLKASQFVGISRSGPPYGNPDASPVTWTVSWNTSNIGFDKSDNSLTLTVPGGQRVAPASCAMLQTQWTDILYGSVRTVAKTSNVSGTVNAIYFYHSDLQESDIEIQTSDPTTIHWTNQNTTVEGGNYPTYTSKVASPWTSYHEYRLDWIPGKTMFYIDGVLKRTIAKSVPSSPAPWLWTNWFNHGRFTGGPPVTDSVMHIKSIDMYVNRTTDGKCGTK